MAGTDDNIILLSKQKRHKNVVLRKIGNRRYIEHYMNRYGAHYKKKNYNLSAKYSVILLQSISFEFILQLFAIRTVNICDIMVFPMTNRTYKKLLTVLDFFAESAKDPRWWRRGWQWRLFQRRWQRRSR